MSTDARLKRLRDDGEKMPESLQELDQMIIERESPDSSVHGDVQSYKRTRPGEVAFAKFYASLTEPTIRWALYPEGGSSGTITVGSLEQTEAQLSAILRTKKANKLLLNDQLLFKLPAASTAFALTTVRDVLWRLNRHGFLEPTIVVDPVIMNNRTVERVTGHNAKYIYDEGIGPLALLRIRHATFTIAIVDAVLGRADPQMPATPWTWAEDGLAARPTDN